MLYGCGNIAECGDFECKTDTKRQKALRFRAVFVFQIQKSRLFLIFVYIKLLSYMEACKWNQLNLCYV